MVSSINPTGVTYTISLNNNSTESAKLTKALAKNQNPRTSVVTTINGRQLTAAAQSGTRIVESMGTARALFATSVAVVSDLIAQLEEMKGELQDLNDASPQILAIGQTNFQNEVARIIEITRTANFNGKNFFDGTLAATNVANSGTTKTSAPYRNQIDFNSFQTTAFPRLAPGVATTVNGADPASVVGSFQPMFGLNAVAGVNTDASTEAARVATLPANTAVAGVAAGAAGVAAGAAGNATAADIAAVAQAAAIAAVNAGVADSTQDLKDIYVRAAIDRAAVLSAGNVTTPVGRAAITLRIDANINILNGIQAQIIGQQGNLEKAKDSMNVQVTELSAAASNLLSADYEKIVPELTQLLREAKVLSLAFGLSERQINTVISQLESTAAAA